MTQVVLVGGPGGAGSSTAAAALADSLASAGSTVAVRAADPEFGATTLVTDAVEILPAAVDLARDELASLVRGQVADLVLPAVQELTVGGVVGALWDLPEQVAGESFDHVVIDVGSGLRTLHSAVRPLRDATARAQGFGPGWARSARPLQALALGSASRSVDAVRALATRSDSVAAIVRSAATVVVHGSHPRADDRTRAMARAVVLGGGRLAAVHPAPGADVGDSLRAELGAYGVPVLGADLDPSAFADPAREPELVGGPKDDLVVWRVPLPFNTIDDVEVDRVGDALVVSAGTARGLYDLPSLLSRYGAHGTRVRHGMLEVAFIPDQEARS